MNYDLLKLYNENKHKNIEKSCKICGVTVKHKYHMSRHIIGHTVTENYKCVECNLVFKRNDILIRHLKSHDFKYRTQQCHLCGKRFYRRDCLQRHIKIHKNVI